MRAIQRVLEEGVPTSLPPPTPLPTLSVVPTQRSDFAIPTLGRSDFAQTLRRALPLASVWPAVQDPYLIAACVPGARLIEVAGDRLRGEVRASLGPIETLFTGEGRISYNAADHRAEIVGDGRDSRTGTRLTAHAVLRLQKVSATSTKAVVAIEYTLRGPLAQFAPAPSCRNSRRQLQRLSSPISRHA